MESCMYIMKWLFLSCNEVTDDNIQKIVFYFIWVKALTGCYGSQHEGGAYASYSLYMNILQCVDDKVTSWPLPQCQLSLNLSIIRTYALF